jgi:hypothetical protein
MCVSDNPTTSCVCRSWFANFFNNCHLLIWFCSFYCPSRFVCASTLCTMYTKRCRNFGTEYLDCSKTRSASYMWTWNRLSVAQFQILLLEGTCLFLIILLQAAFVDRDLITSSTIVTFWYDIVLFTAQVHVSARLLCAPCIIKDVHISGSNIWTVLKPGLRYICELEIY